MGFMAEIPNWRKTRVTQKDPMHGCTPAGYEWLIRYYNVPYVNLPTFQDEFNLESKGINNNFDTIANAIKGVYPNINIKTKIFSNGYDKIYFINSLILNHVPCLISLPTGPNWHTMVVGYIDDTKLTLFDPATGNYHQIPINQIIDNHNNIEGGKDIAWLESWEQG